jgi:hypothetical protein
MHPDPATERTREELSDGAFSDCVAAPSTPEGTCPEVENALRWSGSLPVQREGRFYDLMSQARTNTGLSSSVSCE